MFDCAVDPYELNNLANDPKYKAQLNRLRSEMDEWLETIGDNPELPEGELIKKLWNTSETQPVTAAPNISNQNGSVTIGCDTKGASIGYKLVNSKGKAPQSWTIYQNPLNLPKGAKLLVKAHRIGFEASETIQFQ